MEECEKNDGGYKIPLLEDIMQITKGKIFMNLEIKQDNKIEIWDKIQELIEKYEFYDQISISSFKHDYYEKVEAYNRDFNRSIVFGFLDWTISFLFNQGNNLYQKTNHQISLNAQYIKNNQSIIEYAHNKGMTVTIWFFSDIHLNNEPKNYYEIFDLGIDVIITDYPLRVANQLKDYYSDNLNLEGCNSMEKNVQMKKTCTSCDNGYELLRIEALERNVCKLKYELIPELYEKDKYGIYHEKNIFAIKMLLSPIEQNAICQKNGKTIFYFEWLFDLYGYDYSFSGSYSDPKLVTFIKKYILNKEKIKNSSGFALLTEEHIKRLNFDEIEVYIDNNLVDQKDFVCIDLYDTSYLTTYTVMGAHCYILYNGEEKTSYNVVFRLFDDNYLSFVKYNDKFLINENSWRKKQNINFYPSSNPDPICKNIKDPFQDIITCANKINNCMYCKDENSCKQCNSGFSLFNGQCTPLTDFENNFKYFTPDNGINYYSCSSIIEYCEECYYDFFSYNNFHCTKCSNEFNLDESYECDLKEHINPFTNSLSGKYIGSSCLNEKDQSKCHTHNIDISNFSCFKYNDIFNNKQYCLVYPDNDSIQKEYYKFYLGISKEELSINSNNFPHLYNKDELVIIPEKENYEKDETITFKKIQDIVTEEDKSIFNKSNTCYSHFFEGYSNFYLKGIFPNITNPNICYNVNKFSEHENILDCGYAKISFNYGQKKYNVQTCYFIPDDKISKNLLDYYRRSLIEEMWGKDGTWGKSIKSRNINNENIDINNLKGERKLQENDEISFEMTIQNKNGKVIKYDSKSYDMEIIENNKKSSDNKEEEEENPEPEIFKVNNFNRFNINMLIYMFIILNLI